MTRTLEVSCPTLAGRGGFGIAFAPLIAQGVASAPRSAHEPTRLALALRDAGLVPAVQQRYAGLIDLLIARRP